MKPLPILRLDLKPGEEQELAPDLDWILQSSQVDLPVIAQALVLEQFAPIYALAAAILDDTDLAYFATFEALIDILSNLYQAQNGGSSMPGGPRIWLYRRVLVKIAGIHRRTRLQDSLRSLLTIYEPGRAGRSSPASASPIPELALVLDSLAEQHRLALILIRLQGWSPAEAASLLNVPEPDLAGWLEADWQRLEQALPPPQGNPGAVQLPPPEDRIQEVLWLRWGSPAFTPTDLDKFAAEILGQVESRVARRKRFASLQELIWLAAVISLVLGLLWWAGSTASQEPDDQSPGISAPQELEGSLAPPSNLPSETAPLSKNSAKANQPLTLDSEDEAIRLRLAESHRLWRSFWGDARIVYYGPPGYVGPYRGYRAQVWLKRPRQSLSVIAGLGQHPSRVLLVDGFHRTAFDLRQDRIDFRPASGIGLLPQLETMLFPHRLEWLDQAGSFQAVQVVVIEGRENLVVDFFSTGGNLRARLWIDTRTGIILRQQQMSETDAGVIVSDFRFTSFSIDADLSPALFRLEENRRFGFVNWMDQLPQNAPSNSAEVTSIPGRPRLSRSLDLPSGFDPLRSPLSFDFWSNYDENGYLVADSDEIFADLYAHDPSPFGPAYYLGRVPFVDPLEPLVCSRSPDGRRVAFAALTDPSRLRWFELYEPQEVHAPMPEDRVHELVFAPGSSRLAVSATGQAPAEMANRILILDTDTGTVQELVETTNPSRSLTWSPDGRYLSFLDVDIFNENSKKNELVVLDVETAERVYSAPFSLATASASGRTAELGSRLAASLPPDWPGHAWGVEFPATRRGLEGCAARPDPAGQLSHPSKPVPAGHALIGVRTPINPYRNQVTLFSADLTSQGLSEIAAAWIEPTPLGERQSVFLDDLDLAYSGDRIGFAMNHSLYLFKMDGSPPLRIAGPFEHPISASWSAGGRYVAYLLKHDDRLSDLYILDLACADLPDGCQSNLPGKLIAVQKEIYRLAWSPAEDRLVFEMEQGNNTGKTDLFLVDMQAGSSEPLVVSLTAETVWGGTNPQWLPDGQGLVYLAVQPGDACRYDLMRIDMQGLMHEEILPDLSCAVTDFAISPVGRTLAFVAPELLNSNLQAHADRRTTSATLWLWQIGNTELSDLIPFQAPEDSQGWIRSPVFSSNGKFLLFETTMERVMRLDLASGEVQIFFEVPQPGYQDTPWFWPRIFTILFGPS